jgi:hypothetical protein
MVNTPNPEINRGNPKTPELTASAELLHPQAHRYLGDLLGADPLVIEPTLTQLQAEGFTRELMVDDYPTLRRSKPEEASMRADQIRLHVHGVNDEEIMRVQGVSTLTSVQQGRINTRRLLHNGGFTAVELQLGLRSYLTTFDPKDEKAAQRELLEHYGLTPSEGAKPQAVKPETYQERDLRLNLEIRNRLATLVHGAGSPEFEMLYAHLTGRTVDTSDDRFMRAANIFTAKLNRGRAMYLRRRANGGSINNPIEPVHAEMFGSLLGDYTEISRQPHSLQEFVARQKERNPKKELTVLDLKERISDSIQRVIANQPKQLNLRGEAYGRDGS